MPCENDKTDMIAFLIKAYIGTGLTRFGMCLPSSCSFSEVASALWQLSLKYETVNASVVILPLNCVVGGEYPPLETGDIVML